MQKNKTARKGKASQPVNHACPKKTAKACRQKSAKKARARKPLTPEQRERKNARDRRRRAAKRSSAEATQLSRLNDNRPGIIKTATDTPCSIGRVPCSSTRKGSVTCSNCSPACSNYQTCRNLARTDNLPKLREVKQGFVPVSRTGSDKGPYALDALDAFVRSTLAQMTAEHRNGIVRRHFELPDGVAEVAVCRKVCEVPQVAKDIAGIADRSWSALAEQCVAYLFDRGTGVTRAISQLELDVSRIVDAQHETCCTWFGDDCK